MAIETKYEDLRKHIEITEGVDIQEGYATIRKFGRGTCYAKETKTALMTQATSVLDVEAHTTANLVDTISCTAANTAVLGVEGFTIDTSGDLTFVSQDATLSGTTGVTLGTPLNTVTRLYVKEGTFASPSVPCTMNVYCTESTNAGLTAGAPSTLADTKTVMPANINQTEKALTAADKDQYIAITGVDASLPEGASPTGTAAADISLEIKRKGGVYRPVGLEAAVGAQQRTANIKFDPPVVVPPNSYVRLVANASTPDLTVAGAMSGVVFRKQGT